ncbi:hypothetical protein KAR91_13020 [Candidatus Pacearchaeota archaeon]|nr:hypothetical protein [Candidatus Pacearchaeota archaeon]
MIFQKMSDGTVRRKPIQDADEKEKNLKKLNSIEKALTALISKTIGGVGVKYQEPLKKIAARIRKDRDKLLGKK